MRLKYFFCLTLFITSNFTFANDSCGRYGCPTGAPNSNQEIERNIYTLSNNRTTKFADWVAYRVTPVTIDGPSRSRNFRSDPAIASRFTLETSDYRDAHALLGTDRGHQVPLASFSNTPYWNDTNFLSNITPQSSELNQGPWVRLETAVRNHARAGNEVYVITGPLYEFFFASLPNADERHTVPSGFFKVVATISTSGFVRASAFIMEQDSDRRDNFCTKETTIDEIERRTGLNIFPNFSFGKERAVESRLGGIGSALGC
ncbi:DNA/RNA non-specific endonuclease [Agarilytica rhodophyticola]|uniref:DNA/RNA non-specific endonuclease n=1 Tax=Agarilytica rhodophyticola TaxID=1737490 RepID=UPI000B3436AD|nr:DNA/RNA non-specific endonuclease [Agarilytica rhodophyticola]